MNNKLLNNNKFETTSLPICGLSYSRNDYCDQCPWEIWAKTHSRANSWTTLEGKYFVGGNQY